MDTVVEQPSTGEGQQFSHYRIGGTLGEGGFGRVRLAWDERLAREVAIKFSIGDESGQRGLRYEAQRLAAQAHRVFVAVYALEEHAGQLAMVMERIRGITLAQALDRTGALPAERVLRLGAAVAEALAVAHRHGWAHGDLKPSNVMLTECGDVRILDFGAAAAIDPEQTVSTVTAQSAAGTLAYLAPERLLGARACASGDIYALGLVLHEALKGSRDFEAGAAWGGLHRRLHGGAAGRRLPRGTDAALTDLVERMTRRHAQDRPRSMSDVHRALLKAQEQRHERSRKRAERRAVLGLIVLFGLLAVFIQARDVRLAGAEAVAEAGAAIDPLVRAERLLADFDQAGTVAEAVALLEQRLASDPHDAGAAALLAIGYCLSYAGDERDEVWLSRARAAAQQAEREEPQQAIVQAARGWVEEYLNNKADAEAHYLRARMLDPSDRHALLGLARLYAQSGRASQAQQVLADAMRRLPADRGFVDTQGTLLYQQGDLAGAEQAFHRSILLKPNGVQAYVSLSGVLLRANRLDEALHVLQQGLRQGSNGRLYGNLGTLLYMRGDYAEAATAFERALSDAKGSPNDYLKWANLGDTLRWLPGREAQARAAHQRALQMVDTLLQRSPDSATLQSRSALYAARLGQASLARQRIDAALAGGNNNADLQFRAALVAELGGRREAALAHLQDAIARGYPPHMIAGEPDLLALRRDRRYHRMLTGKTE
ncbi:serine/threonine-protein kinase [Stenotrophomonas maltophilia]|uniref:serine/threonine-protein kinase n=1 Tax=Stenotrophomonas maltophilia TaxID=40324 RepID=UPI000C14C461|nr:serine/threonine-protein kinase [Stenotrophomonas maltophilia]EKT4097473.1 protein kinase [Stenotrophomonas maltophilia]MBA0288383.1 serine/threonine-protein kinase [Stenotrophomonas maltophilia]QBL44851.1 serine/threonine-protein kinase [Stenotrophomonas maltophilia]